MNGGAYFEKNKMAYAILQKVHTTLHSNNNIMYPFNFSYASTSIRYGANNKGNTRIGLW